MLWKRDCNNEVVNLHETCEAVYQLAKQKKKNTTPYTEKVATQVKWFLKCII